MVFSDLFFIFAFLPAFFLSYLIAYFIDRKILKNNNDINSKAKNWVLVFFSFIFYAWGEPVYVFLMLICVVFNFISGRIIDRQDKHRKAALIGGLICNLLILAIFKYAGFLTETVNSLGLNLPIPKIALPIGISFYTFQSISYLIDVYRKEAPAQKNYFNLLLYISMFPQLIAGPIVRYNTIAKEIHKRNVTSDDVAEGIFRFLIGLGKKVIIANQFSELSDQFLANGVNNITTTGAWIGAVAFTLQIYFDFSGYSDMAIGLGRAIGFHFNENFKHPYCCDSISDFWRRWHISLGSFFRDYLYIPLGGNRKHQFLNILVVWFLTGMWHGASWNFIIWGLYFGLIVSIEKYTLLKVKDKIPAVLLHCYSIILIVLGWVIFYFDDFGKMTHCLGAVFGQAKSFHDVITTNAITDNFILWVVAIIFCMPVREWALNMTDKFINKDSSLSLNIKLVTKIIVSVFILFTSIALLVGATNNAFLYTRF